MEFKIFSLHNLSHLWFGRLKTFNWKTVSQCSHTAASGWAPLRKVVPSYTPTVLPLPLDIPLLFCSVTQTWVLPGTYYLGQTPHPSLSTALPLLSWSVVLWQQQCQSEMGQAVVKPSVSSVTNYDSWPQHRAPCVLSYCSFVWLNICCCIWKLKANLNQPMKWRVVPRICFERPGKFCVWWYFSLQNSFFSITL